MAKVFGDAESARAALYDLQFALEYMERRECDEWAQRKVSGVLARIRG